jgi:hypothetical protein
MATQTTTYTTTSYQSHDNVMPPKPPSLMDIGQSSLRIDGGSVGRMTESTTITAANNVGNTVANALTSYGMGQNPMVYNSIDMTASNVHTAY